mmetsp:Transcript_52703/g.138230  ORF Transcript_52703/g.138230 Transcript_52703/m.138230 type:complete len:248 (-) Transcript_52703:19-762(-)
MPAPMSSMPELLNKLTEREKERLAAEQAATASIRAAEAKVNATAEELLELKRANEHELRVLKAQYEKHVRDTTYACRQQVRKAQQEAVDAEAAAERAEKRRQSSEVHVANLQKKLEALKAHIQRRSDNTEFHLAGLDRMMSARIHRVTAQSENRVERMNQHANQVRKTCNRALHHIEGELQDQMARAHVRAEGRVRYKELCDLAARCAKCEMTEESYKSLKAELLGLWRLQSTTHCPRGRSMLAHTI